MGTITIGVDLAKSVFSVCALDGTGHVRRRQDLKREASALAVDACDARIADHVREDARCRRLREMIGVGPIIADAWMFKNGRQLAAWLGLVPTQHSSGGHARLGGISCRGDAYLRTLLIQDARSSLQRVKPQPSIRPRRNNAGYAPLMRACRSARYGGHRQQARPTDLGHARARRRLRPARLPRQPHAPTSPVSLSPTPSPYHFVPHQRSTVALGQTHPART
jgi:hypothetical protein